MEPSLYLKEYNKVNDYKMGEPDAHPFLFAGM